MAFGAQIITPLALLDIALVLAAVLDVELLVALLEVMPPAPAPPAPPPPPDELLVALVPSPLLIALELALPPAPDELPRRGS